MRQPNDDGLFAILDSFVSAESKALGLVAAKSSGRGIIVPDGPKRGLTAPRCKQCLWPVRDDADAPLGHWIDVPHEPVAILEAARIMLATIITLHGPGRVWHLGSGLVHLVNDDGMWLRHDEYADRMLVRLRSFHNHEYDAVSPRPQIAPTSADG